MATTTDAAFKAWLLLAPAGTLVPAEAHDDLMRYIPTKGFIAWGLDDGRGRGFTLRVMNGKAYFERDAHDTFVEIKGKGR